jgi:ABC-2 type transport system permease protein
VLIAVIIVFMGSVVGEVERGTAILVLTKSSSRASFVIAKFLAAVVILIISLLIAYAGCLFYTIILFPDVSFNLSLQATLLFLIFSIYILSVTIGISAIVKSQIVAGVAALSIYFVSSIISLFNNGLGYYSPGRLLKYQSEILNGTVGLSDVFLTSAVTIIISLAFLFLGIAIFNKREFYSNN